MDSVSFRLEGALYRIFFVLIFLLACVSSSGCSIAGTSVTGAQEPAPAATAPQDPAPAPSPFPAPASVYWDLATRGINIGGINSSIPLALPSKKQKNELVWNSWLEKKGEVVDSITPGTRADLLVDISKYAYTTTSWSVGRELQAELKKMHELGEATHLVIFRSYILGSGTAVEFSDKNIDVQKGIINLSALGKDDASLFEDAVGGADSNAITLNKNFGLSTLRLPIHVKNGAEKCFQVAVTVWNESDFRPLDHLVISVSSEKNNICQHPIQGGFSTMAIAASGDGYPLYDGFFQIFEYETNSGPINTKAIFLDRASYEKSGGKSGLYSWEIQSKATDYLNGQGLYSAIKKARLSTEKEKYREISQEFKSKIFPVDIYDNNGNSNSAFLSLMNLGSESANPRVMARFVSVSGKNVYAPFGILNAHPMIKRKFTLSYSLPRENRVHGKCIARWALAYPVELDGQPASLEWDESTMNLPHGKGVRLADINALRCYFKDDAAENCSIDIPDRKNDKPEALILLAHHDNGLIWYSDSEQGLNRIPIDSEPRTFSAGSVAFLSACSVLNSSSDSARLVSRLNDYGMDAIVASPFPVDSEYGILLSKNLIKIIARGYKENKKLSVYDIFAEANNLMREDKFYSDKYRDMSYEFIHEICFYVCVLSIFNPLGPYYGVP